jgi:hypothetical protein
VFDDRQRTLAYFGVIEDVRNSIAHSRDLVPFERELISGIAGHLRNQASLYRSGMDEASRYYPRIESIRDSFGIEGARPEEDNLGRTIRLEVGQVITFTGRAVDAKNRDIHWLTSREFDVGHDATTVATGGAGTDGLRARSPVHHP